MKIDLLHWKQEVDDSPDMALHKLLAKKIDEIIDALNSLSERMDRVEKRHDDEISRRLGEEVAKNYVKDDKREKIAQIITDHVMEYKNETPENFSYEIADEILSLFERSRI